MCHLMHKRLHILNLAHTLIDSNSTFFLMVISLCSTCNLLKLYRNRAASFQCIKEMHIILYISQKFIHPKRRKFFPLRLTHIKYTDQLKGRYFNFYHFLNRTIVFIQNWLISDRIDFIPLLFYLIGCRGKYPDTLFPLHHMAVMVMLPCCVPGYQCCIRFLHGNQHGIV